MGKVSDLAQDKPRRRQPQPRGCEQRELIPASAVTTGAEPSATPTTRVSEIFRRSSTGAAR